MVDSNERLVRKLVLEISALVVLLLGVSVFLVPVYFNWQEAQISSWETLSFRIMDSISPFQEKFHDANGHYAHGIYDRNTGDSTITELTDWKPSVTDKNRYEIHVIGKNAFKVSVKNEDGRTLCRMYPSLQPCFVLQTYLLEGH